MAAPSAPRTCGARLPAVVGGAFTLLVMGTVTFVDVTTAGGPDDGRGDGRVGG